MLQTPKCHLKENVIFLKFVAVAQFNGCHGGHFSFFSCVFYRTARVSACVDFNKLRLIVLHVPYTFCSGCLKGTQWFCFLHFSFVVGQVFIFIWPLAISFSFGEKNQKPIGLFVAALSDSSAHYYSFVCSHCC